MNSNISDFGDPELDELEPLVRNPRVIVKPREIKMAEPVMEDVAEVKDCKVTGPLNVKGLDYVAGDTIALTEEEHATLVELRANIEGVEPMTPEEIQAAHDEGVEAQKEKIEANAEAEEGAEAKA